MRIAICEDNIQEAASLRRLMDEYTANRPGSHTLEAYGCAEDLLAVLNNDAEFDIYLLDILMPGMDGIELSRKLRGAGRRGIIIFLTTTREYAYEAFGVRAMDYLLKPVEKNGLFAALDNAVSLLGGAKKSYALIQMADADRMVDMADIIAVEVQGHTLCYYLAGGEELKSKVLRVPFGAVTEDLSADGRFIRPHRSFLINASHVTSITKKTFVMSNGMEIPISRLRFSEVKEEYMDYLTHKGDAVWSMSNGYNKPV